MTKPKNQPIEDYRAVRRHYYQEHREHIIELRRSYRDTSNAWKRNYYIRNRDECIRKAAIYRAQNKDKMRKSYAKHHARVKLAVFTHYGLECACCGESQYEFLSIDHINGGGHKHLKEIGGAGVLYDWLIKNNFPEGFQTLCFNCNLAKGFFGVCPHQEK